MFVRIKRGGNKNHPHDYLQIVESYRERGKPKHRLIANLGRLDGLAADGQLDRLVQSLARFSQNLRVLSAAQAPQVNSCQSRLWGPPLVFARLWQRQGLPEILGQLAEGRHFQFDVERVVFALALQRLCAPGSDLFGSHWVKSVQAPGWEPIELQHFYRTVQWLAEEREGLEKALFDRDRDLFGQQLDLLFVDTTSLYVYRERETALRRRGYSRDRRPDLPQIVLCVAVDRQGWPVAWEFFPDNTADTQALVKIVTTLRSRLKVGRVIIVADRGMISQKILGFLSEDREAPFEYIIGCRMRKQKEVSQEVLARGGRFHKVAGNLEVKQVMVKERRYIVCRNPEEARKDATARQALLEKLEETLARGPKALLGNRGFARFLQMKKGAAQIDPEAVRADARLDGKFVLRTSTQLSAEEVAESYKSLWRVERTFREKKSTLEVRPIFHQRDDTSVGHIVPCFLALRLEVDLQRRLDRKGVQVSWPTLMHELSQVRSVRLDLDGRSWLIRTDLEGAAHAAFAAAGVRPPSRITPLEESSA